MLRQIARRTGTPDEANAFAQRVSDLHRAVAGDGGDPAEAAQALRSSLEALTRAIAAHAFTDADLRAMLAGLAEDGARGEYRDYAGAEQATMAMAGLLGYLARRGELQNVRAANAALDRLYDAVKDDEAYRPERFGAAVEALAKTVNTR
jgi:serine/threonine protein kinase HipA of HipAB toxin-antitoxin module